MTLLEAVELKNVVVIINEWWGLSPRDRWQWTAYLNHEVLNYHRPDVLISEAERDGLPWIQFRVHRHKKGEKKHVSIIRKS